MNRNQLLILVLALAVLGGAALMLIKRDSQTRQGGGRADGTSLLADLPVGEELAQVIIRQETNTLTLTKAEGIWAVAERGNYPASYSEISRTVLKLRDLKAVQTEQVGESQLARLELLEPGSETGAGTLIEFRDKAGQPLASLLLGKQQMGQGGSPQPGGGADREMPVGRWVMNPNDKTRVAVVSDLLSNVEPVPGAWLDKDFFKVQKIKSIEVTYPDAATNSFKLSRETESGAWTLDGLEAGKEVDTTKTSGFNYALSNPSFDDVIVGGDAAELGLDQPKRIAIETFEGFHYDIATGKPMEGKMPLRVVVKGTYPRERDQAGDEDESVKAQKDKEFADMLKTRDEKLQNEQALEPWTFLVSSWTVDSVLKKRGDLVKDKEVAEPPAEPEAPADPVEGLLDLPPAN